MNFDPQRLTAAQIAAETACLLGADGRHPGTARLAAAIAAPPPVSSGRVCPRCDHLLDFEPATTEGDPTVIGGLNPIPACYSCPNCDWSGPAAN